MTVTHQLRRLQTLVRTGPGWSQLSALRRDQRGNTVVPMAIAMPVLIGMMGLAGESSYWYLHQRAMQNAADAAAIAAAMNGGPSYAAEAEAVAAQYGFSGGNVKITVTNPTTATNCTGQCYSVTITDAVPLYISEVIGYKGTTTINNNQPATQLAATSIAKTAVDYPYCILALGGSGAQGITSNGAAKANLQGCTVMSNTSASCSHNLNASIGDAHGTNSGCGITQHSNVPAVSDPYAKLASQIPQNTCATYPQEPQKKKDPPLPASNQLNGLYNWNGNEIMCGDVQLTGNTTISGNAVLVIENGRLDLNGFTLTGASLTIVFSGANNAIYQHIITGSGTLDVAAPTSGAWSGIAIYQDPALTTNVDMSYAGNTPTWNLTGLVYLPHASVTFSGTVNKSSNGATCFGLVVDNITISGTGNLVGNDSQCGLAGLGLPQGGRRGTLVD
jgi:Flp pilus assembly protein TadG